MVGWLLVSKRFLHGFGTVVGRLAVVAMLVVLIPIGAGATVSIATGTTQNVTCMGGVCEPTAANAILNVGDLETLLASGNVTVTTTGSGVQAADIEVDTALSWSAGSTLTLDAYQSITVTKPVSVKGLGGLTLLTDDGGSGGILSFGKRGNVDFATLSGDLTINGTAK